jgi:hypothetical protein
MKRAHFWVATVSVIGTLLVSGCAEQSAMQGACMEHRQTEFGNQTYWDSCPAETLNSPWRGPTAGR